MPFVRRMLRGRVRKVYRARRPLALRRARRRGMFNPMPTFTETADFGPGQVSPVTGNFLGQLTCSLQSIPQVGNYRALYNQARILKATYILIPNYNEFSQGTDVGLTTLPVSAPRIAWAVQDTANVPTPTSELDVLTDNGSKIRQFVKPIKITCRPVASLSEAIMTGIGAYAGTNQKAKWLTFDGSGVAVPHVGVNLCVTQDFHNTANPPIGWHVYAKITFQLRDPK